MIKSKQTENQKIVWDWTSFLFILFLRMRPHTRTHCTKKGDCEGEARCLRATYTRGREHHSLLELPAEILNKILEYISFKEHATVRRVSQEINIKIKETIATGFPKWIFFWGGGGWIWMVWWGGCWIGMVWGRGGWTWMVFLVPSYFLPQ